MPADRQLNHDGVINVGLAFASVPFGAFGGISGATNKK